MLRDRLGVALAVQTKRLEGVAGELGRMLLQTGELGRVLLQTGTVAVKKHGKEPRVDEEHFPPWRSEAWIAVLLPEPESPLTSTTCRRRLMFSPGMRNDGDCGPFGRRNAERSGCPLL